MQYILNQSEYDEYMKCKEESTKANKILRKKYNRETFTYEINEDDYRTLWRVLGNDCGSAYKVNLCGKEFVLSPDDNDTHHRISQLIKEL